MEIIGNGHLAKTIKKSMKELELDGKWTIIAIDTPINPDLSVDLKDIEQAVIAQKDNNNLVIIMSPVPVGTCRKLQKKLGRKLAYNPENLRLNAGKELYLQATRQIVGCDDELFTEMSKFLSWYKGNILWMSLESAEMAKHATNCFLATSIEYANDVYSICNRVKADYDDVCKAMKTDERIGEKAYLTPGEPSQHLKRDVKILNDL